MNRIVFDSHDRRLCSGCQKPVKQCACKKTGAVAPATDGIVRVRREVRRGKPMTVVIGVPLNAADLKQLAKAFKKKCGGGGTAKDGVIEIQGDHRDLIVAELEARGYEVKLAGG